VDDAKFRNAFALLSIDTGGQRKKLCKYIFARLEEDVSGRSCDPDTDFAPITSDSCQGSTRSPFGYGQRRNTTRSNP
jgi:hypothetical protein